MSTEMQRLERARPDVAPPTAAARAHARDLLHELIAAAPGASWPGEMPPRPRRRRPQLSALVFVGGSVGALIIAIAALVLLHHGRQVPAHHVAGAPPVTGGERGPIVTRDGTVLADTGTLYNVFIETHALPRSQAARTAEYARLEPLLLGHRQIIGECTTRGGSSVALGELACEVAAQQERGASQVLIAVDRPARTVRPILADKGAFPGVRVVPVQGRNHPNGGLAEQLLGTVGQSGLESAYGRYLRAGDTLHVSIDTALQRTGERSLARTIRANPLAGGGAFVVMDPENGQVLALGSAGGSDYDRAIAGAGPAGSIFMPLTALAGLQSGARTAARLWQWMNALGMGHRTGIDAGGEMRGYIQRPRTADDTASLASGEGVLNVTPLQIAVAYAAIANGGRIVRPHVGLSVTNAGGATVDTVRDRTVRTLEISPQVLQTVRAGMRAAVSAPAGAAAGVFGSFPMRVFGKTGTAQVNGKSDNAWFVGYVPASVTNKPILVVVYVMEGGFGGVAAAPVARQIMSQWLFGTPGPFIPGSSTS